MEFEDKLYGFEGTEDEPDEEFDDVITLLTDEGKKVDFIEIAGIAYKGHFYAIMQPEELFENMEDDEAFVFRVTRGRDGEDRYEMETDDEIIDAIFDEYNKLYDEAMTNKNYGDEYGEYDEFDDEDDEDDEEDGED